MGNKIYTRRSLSLSLAALFFACLLLTDVNPARAASWGNLEPLKSRRADVERELGPPLAVETHEDGALRFKVNGGTVVISFVTPKFIAAKKLSPEYEGTILQILLQHEGASDTPESLKLTKDSDFVVQSRQNVATYTNARKGLIYTFVNGKLKTSWYNASAEQLARARNVN
jgi:hypothetical protein